MQQTRGEGSEGQVSRSREAKLTVGCLTCSWELEVDLGEGVVTDLILGEDVHVDALPTAEHGGSSLLMCRDCTDWMRRLRASGIEPDVHLLRSAIEIGTEYALRHELPPEVVVERNLMRLYQFSADLREMWRAQFFDVIRRSRQNSR